MKKTEMFQQLLASKDTFILPGAFDAMTARIIEETGFKAIYATGAGISNAQLGWADVGLTTLTEIAQVVSWMSEVTTVPIVVDADTGFGNAINMQRTVKVLEKAGAAALQIEDQVMPKKCGHFNGKEVISKDEMVGKIKAALDARTDDQLAIIARTDALGVLGFDEAIERANAYKEAGAHAIFVEAPTTYEQLSRITKEVPGIPHIINLVEGGKTPLVSRQEAQNLGFQIMLCANSALRGAIKGATDAMQILMRDESQENIHDVICTWEQRQELFKLKEIQQLEKQYS
ncbi:2-methylisocitrate lyase-like PEP mutase family enzyme [Solibacillus kalamii]|uniref:Carboxyvinyl-carboxyphosphonate phosphorylmutase n=1 Tax=Solibacillus kalamii TaxID=1748298 RepID=A0ABX3ZHM5_9BACL|nr:oxaloacetate decarboxylase [Solibacillus kalamii]MBM7665404.1 2-methylisocitrate lyase-like PEP mutase family enzyme [Solibacillus kalamii]OUZ39235.1 carboxyvinyl-carboxyphosphonate phosphorylmutase [Solibacillus kalamii]